MSLETDLQNVISSATNLNQNVQGKIDEINSELATAIAQQQSQVDSTRNSLTSSINSAINGLDLRSSTFSGWHFYDEPVKIKPACVVGNEWAITDDGSVDVTAEQFFSDSDINTASPAVYDPAAGTYVAAGASCVNPWEAIGATAGYDSSLHNYNNEELGFKNGGWFSPTAVHPETGEKWLDADGNPEPAYYDFPWYKLGSNVSSTSSTNRPGYYLDDYKIPHFVMRGSIQGANHRQNRTFIQFQVGNTGSHDAARRPRQGDSSQPFYARFDDSRTRAGDRQGHFWQPTQAEIDAAIAAGEQPRQGMFAIQSRGWNHGNNTLGGGNYPAFFCIPMTAGYSSAFNYRMYNWGRREIAITAIGVIWMPPIEPYTP